MTHSPQNKKVSQKVLCGRIQITESPTRMPSGNPVLVEALQNEHCLTCRYQFGKRRTSQRGNVGTEVDRQRASRQGSPRETMIVETLIFSEGAWGRDIKD
jgi:hypothetical protein